MTARQTAIAAIATCRSPPPRTSWSTPARPSTASTCSTRRPSGSTSPSRSSSRLRRTIDGLEPFDPVIADAVAHGVKEWAHRPRCDPLHPLVRADDRLHRREARLVPEPDRRRPHDRRVLGPDADPGRARRVVVPVGRDPGDVRGPRLHRVGRDVADLPAGRAQRRHHDDPDRLRLVHGRGARPQDPAPALAGGPGQGGAARPALVRQHERVARVHDDRPRAGVLPHRPPPGRAAPGPAAHRPDAVRRPVAQGPGARGPVLRLDPRADPRVHDGSRPRAVAARHPGQDAPQRGRPGPVRDGAGVRADVGRLRPQHDRDVDDAPGRAAARPRVPHPREAVRRHQRLGQAQQLVDVDRRGREPARPGHRPARKRAVPRVPRSPSSARSTSTPTSCARPSPTPARTTASAPTRRRRRSCRSSSARSSRT